MLGIVPGIGVKLTLWGYLRINQTPPPPRKELGLEEAQSSLTGSMAAAPTLWPGKL